MPANLHFGTGNPVADQLVGHAYPAHISPESIAQPLAQTAPVAAIEYGARSSVPAKTRDDIVALDAVIRQTIEEAILVCDGSVPKAARALDVSPSTLYRRLQSWAANDAKLREKSGPQAA